MKLGDIFNQTPGEPLIGKEITIRLLKDGVEGQETYRIKGIFRILSEMERRRIHEKAEEALKEEFKDSPVAISEETRALEHKIWQFVFCIYDPDDIRKRLFDKDVALFKKGLTTETIIQVSRAYDRYIKEEFPDELSAEELDELTAEAVKK